MGELTDSINSKYQTEPISFGAKHTRYFAGRPITLRENIATLTLCDVGIGVLSGPLHFAASVGLPTIVLYCDQPLHRAAPAYFLNSANTDQSKLHRTILGPSPSPNQFLKYDDGVPGLTPVEQQDQGWHSWTKPGRQSTKSCLAVITVDEIMTVLEDVIHPTQPRHANI